MQITPIFPVGLGKASERGLLPIARQLFVDNQAVLASGDTGLVTTLLSYNSLHDCRPLNNLEAVEEIKTAIQKNAMQFYAGIGFDVDQLQFDVANIWLNEMRSGSYHVAHSHYGFQVSGCFYVDVPPGSDLIKLYTPLKKIEHGSNPKKDFGPYNAQFFKADPQEGDMFFWESMMVHEVPELEFSGVRRSIAYDVAISRKTKPVATSATGMCLQDYVAIYNINNDALCRQVVKTQDESVWQKHSYNNPVTETNTSYADDLDVSYQGDAVTNKLQDFFEQCVREYITTVPLSTFSCKAVTRIRFNRYKAGTNMKTHVDHIHTIFDGERKGVPTLSVLALLNDDFEGGDFVMFDGKKIKLSVGDVIVFPSNFLYPHSVTTVTKGVRHSCVAWAY
jgi:uncharacterized protein (TIGR02466 family)